VIHAPRFLETFLPQLEGEGVVDQVNDALMSNEEIWEQEGWTKFAREAMVTNSKRGKGKKSKSKPMTRHRLFNKPLEGIVNTIIDEVSQRQGECGLQAALNILMLWIGDCCPSESSAIVHLVDDGVRPFVSERPDVSRTDGALLFLYQAYSRSKENEATPPIK
jgi:hypothetical protein